MNRQSSRAELDQRDRLGLEPRDLPAKPLPTIARTIAETIARIAPCSCGGNNRTDVAELFADLLAHEYQEGNFNREQFLEACGRRNHRARAA